MRSTEEEMTAALPRAKQGSAILAPLPARTAAMGRYLETIFCIATEAETVHPSRIALWLNVSAPTVSVMLQRLRRDGWIGIGTDRTVTLTAAGRYAATDIVRRHRLVECWLAGVLDLDWASAHTEATRLAAALSDEVLTRLDIALGEPTTCPHGHVIPGRAVPYGDLVPLADLEPHTPAVVRRISEIIEHEALQVLQDLAAHGVRIGLNVITAEADCSDSVAVIVADDPAHQLRLTTSVARLIWVEPTR
jgi:DtxR family transcriptional regulator, Mn-dependent transcriptional regulator